MDGGASSTAQVGSPPPDRRRFRRTGLIAFVAAVVLVAVLLVIVRPWSRSSVGTPSGSGSDSPGASVSSSSGVSDSAGLIFGDDFDADLSGFWQPMTDGWSVTDGELAASPGPIGQWKTIMLNRDLPTDVVVSYRTKVSGDGVPGLMLHASGDQFVGVQLNEITQTVKLTTGYLMADGRAAGGQPTLRKTCSLEAGIWHRVTVTAQGGRYTVAVDGSTAAQYDDTKGALSSSGRLGLTAYGAEVRFDDLTIRQL